MKLSEETLDVLKNFSGINLNLLVKPGNKVSTISPAKNVVGMVDVEENFSTGFGIYDLHKFLGTISLFNNPTFDFEEKYVVVSEDGSSPRVKYWFSDPNHLTAMNKKITMPDAAVEFVLTGEMLADAIKASQVLQLPDLAVVSEEGASAVSLKVFDSKSKTSNDYVVETGAETDANIVCTFLFKTENLKMISGSYDVAIAESAISQFTHKSKDVSYFLALENDSEYSAAGGEA